MYPWAVAQWSRPPEVARRVAGAAASPGVVGPVAGIPPAYRNLVFIEIVLFVVILAAAYAYAWRKGVFEWR